MRDSEEERREDREDVLPILPAAPAAPAPGAIRGTPVGPRRADADHPRQEQVGA
jgi:hypothetical protein